MANTAEEILIRLKQTSVYIPAPDSGSGYLVAPKRIATAAHVVKNWREGESYPVRIGVEGPVCQARLIKADTGTDSAVLAFDDELALEPLPVAETLKRNVAWEGYGFPALSVKNEAPAGLPIDGYIKDPAGKNDRGQPAILLYSDEVAAGNASPLHGFSGSPVVVAGTLVGHLTKHLGDPDDRERPAYGYAYACPIDAVIKLLDVQPQKVNAEPPVLETLTEVIPPIEEGSYHVFVSYRSTDRPWAMSLVARLEGAGLRVFIDQQELELGGYLAEQLQSALARSRSAVMLVSKGWLESPWCQQEANVLIKRAVEDGKFKLLSLRLDDSKMPLLLDSRLWFDFNGKRQAEGKDLERLINALIGRTPPADSPAVRADAAEGLVVDKFVKAIWRAARGDGKQILDELDEWYALSSNDVAPLIAAAEAFNSKGMFECALDVLGRATDQTLRVRQLRAFALSKTGKNDEAIRMLEQLREEGALDSETGGLLAGRYKRLWTGKRDKQALLRSYQLYSETFVRTGDPFNGINAAAMALQCEDLPGMYKFGGQVLDSLSKRKEEELTHWDLATVGEAYLLQGRFDQALDWYAKATAKAAGMHQDIAVMRWQARLELKALKGTDEQLKRLEGALPVPRVLAYFGHMVDEPNRPSPRFPPNKVGALRRAIRERIEKYGALHGFGQAARGTDLIFLEELVRRDLTATVVLPFPEADFLAMSGGDEWNDRFAKLRASKQVTFTKPLNETRPADAELPKAFANANREVQRLALEYANRLDEKPIVVAVWDRKQGDGPGGTADAVRLWEDEAYDVDVIDITTI